MGLYSFFDRDTWTDPWFADLSLEGKLLFVHLFTSPFINQAGVYEAPLSMTVATTGLDRDSVDLVLKELAPKALVLDAAHGLRVFVKRFHAIQRNYKRRPDFHDREVAECLRMADEEVNEAFLAVYPDFWERLEEEQQPKSHPPKLGASGEGTRRKGAGTAAAAPSPEFDAFWACYPLKTGKIAARKAFDKARKLCAPDKLVEAATRYASDPNRADQYTVQAARWLNEGRWDDDPLPKRDRSEPIPERVRQEESELRYELTLARIQANAKGEAVPDASDITEIRRLAAEYREEQRAEHG